MIVLLSLMVSMGEEFRNGSAVWSWLSVSFRYSQVITEADIGGWPVFWLLHVVSLWASGPFTQLGGCKVVVQGGIELQHNYSGEPCGDYIVF